MPYTNGRRKQPLAKASEPLLYPVPETTSSVIALINGRRRPRCRPGRCHAEIEPLIVAKVSPWNVPWCSVHKR